MTDVEMRTYEIRFTDRGPIRITIPATWKVTYGALVPSKAGSSGGPHGIRIWEGTDKQRAVFANVASFRDLSLDILVAAVRKYGTQEWFLDDGRTWLGDAADQVEKSWLPEGEVATARIEPDVFDDESGSITYRAGMTKAVKYR